MNDSLGRSFGSGNLLSIQYLRGVAAVAVVYFHSSVYLPQAAWGLPRQFGYFGVDLFFVISGFIMFAITAEKRDGIATFLRKRVIRIVPLYWGATLATLGLFLVMPGAFIKNSADISHVILSMLFIPHTAANGDQSPFFKIGWTLNFEMYFYVVFAASLLIGSLKWRLIAMGAYFSAFIAYGLIFGAHNAALGYYTNPIVLEFLMGSLIGYIALRGGLRRISLPVAAALVLLPFAVIVLNPNSDPIGRVIWLGIPSAAIVMGLLSVESAGRLPKIRLLGLFGDASYSIYLAHPFVMTAARAITQRFHLPVDQPATGAAIIIGACALSVLFGIGVYRFIEMPMLHFLRGTSPSRKAVPNPG